MKIIKIKKRQEGLGPMDFLVKLVGKIGIFLLGVLVSLNAFAYPVSHCIIGVVYHSGADFNLLLGHDIGDVRAQVVEALVGELLGIGEDHIWVNLSPEIGSSQVFPPDLYGTRTGKILLEMDLQLKQDVMDFIAQSGFLPEGDLRKDFPLMRVWIIPGKVEVAIKGKMLYIVKAELNVSIEEGINNPYIKALAHRVLPQLRNKINNSLEYRPLRDLFRAVIVARFLKQKIDSPVAERLIKWTSASPIFYSRRAYFWDYLNSLFFPEELGVLSEANLLVGGINFSDLSWQELSLDTIPQGTKYYIDWLKTIIEYAAQKTALLKRKGIILRALSALKEQLAHQGKLASWDELLGKLDSGVLKNFLNSKFKDLSEEEKSLLVVFLNLASLEEKDKRKLFGRKVPPVANIVLRNMTVLRDFPVMARKSELEFLYTLGLSRVVNLLNLYILGKKGAETETLKRWEREFSELWTNTDLLWRKRLAYGFMPVDRLEGKIMDLKKKVSDKVSRDIFAVLKTMWSDYFVNTDWPVFYQIYQQLRRGKVSENVWLNLIILETLKALGPDVVRDSLIKERLSAQLDKIIKEREEARNNGDTKRFSHLQALFVDIMKIVGEVYPDLVREKLRYKFEEVLTDKDWDEYRREYEEVLGKNEADKIFSAYEELAKKLIAKGKRRIVLFNATFFGGGVAEMIPGLYKFFQKYGITLDWYIVEPRNPEAFYGVTKKVHNICQGDRQDFTKEDEQILRQVGEDNFQIYKNIINAPDVGAVFFEDPQVLTLLEAALKHNSHKKVNYIFRLHIDITGLEQAKKGSGAYNVANFMNTILRGLHSRGGILLFQPYQVPSQWRQKERVYEQPPGIDINNKKNKYREDGEKDISGTVKYFLHQLSSKIVDTGSSIKDLADLWKEPVWLTGARADGWKGILQTIEAYNRFRKMLEEGQKKGKIPQDIKIPKLVVGAGGADDDPEVGQIKEKIISLIEHSPYAKDIVFVWNVQGGQVSSLYRLAKEGGLAYIACSVREGYNLMVEESARQGALIITTNAGGLYRFVDKRSGPAYRWVVDVRGDKVLSKATLGELTAMSRDGTKLVGETSERLAEKIADMMFRFWRTYQDNPDKYKQDSESLYKKTLRTSLVVMGMQYLNYAVDVAGNAPDYVVMPEKGTYGRTGESGKARELEVKVDALKNLDREILLAHWKNALFPVLTWKAGLLTLDNQQVSELVGKFYSVLKVFYPEGPDLFGRGEDLLDEFGAQGDVKEMINLLGRGDIKSLKKQISELFGLHPESKLIPDPFKLLEEAQKKHNLVTKVAVLALVMDSLKAKVVASGSDGGEAFLPILNGLRKFVIDNITEIELEAVLGAYERINSAASKETKTGGIELQ